jgi:flagellar biosynthesis protein FlhA
MSDILLSGSTGAERKNARDIGFVWHRHDTIDFLLTGSGVFNRYRPAFSIALSVLILMVALWVERPLDFSAFPTVLLVATLLRLALNIATTRLILANGSEGLMAAGYIIRGFSKLVMSGDFVIGLVVFAILITVNFVVITKGATRIAEVGAKFTLDAIPGKQMAIDADLSAGLIDDKEAQRRRRELDPGAHGSTPQFRNCCHAESAPLCPHGDRAPVCYSASPVPSRNRSRRRSQIAWNNFVTAIGSDAVLTAFVLFCR